MAEPLKLQFGAPVVRRLAREISDVHPGFAVRAFERDALRGFDELELIDRGRHLAAVLQRHLPSDYPAALDVLMRTIPPVRPAGTGMAAFFYLTHTEFVRQFGLEHFGESMDSLRALTRVFTSEFAIRPFLAQHQDRTLQLLHGWARDADEHVRRLVSEGTRPRLPWAPVLRAFQRDPAPVLELLEHLRDDPSLYVRRSVANNLNDIGKDHPSILTDTAARWMQGASSDREWIVRHALRSAVKRGDPAALAVLGFTSGSRLVVAASTITPARPLLGGRVTIQCTLHNPTRRTERTVADLRVHFVKANGERRAKVFKLATVTVEPGEQITVRKTISLADLTTRAHYPGRHPVDVQLNGAVQPLGQFTIRRP